MSRVFLSNSIAVLLASRPDLFATRIIDVITDGTTNIDPQAPVEVMSRQQRRKIEREQAKKKNRKNIK